MQVKLGINAGFAINRFPEPEVWIRIVGEELGLRYVQFVADLLNPFLPYRVIERQIDKIRELAEKYNVRIDTTFTSMFTRVNHLMHPDPLIREAWFQWFKDFFAMSAQLGARGAGSHFGIMTVTDLENPQRKKEVTEIAINLWQQLSLFASDLGFEFLMNIISVHALLENAMPMQLANAKINPEITKGFLLPLLSDQMPMGNRNTSCEKP